jgi:hypothetical protein
MGERRGVMGYDVEPDEAYDGWKWDYSKMRDRKKGRQSAQPFAVSLADVLATQSA